MTALPRLLFALAALLLGARLPHAAEPAAERHSLWSLEGRNNTIYLLGSIHFLKPSEPLPEALDAAYRDAETLVMEIDMDDLDPLEMQALTLELGLLPADRSLEQELGPETYRKVAEKARALGIEPLVLDRMRPWLAALTLVQVHLMGMGLDPSAGVEQRMTQRALRDGKPIHGLETLREQLGMLAGLAPEQQREFLMYSVEDTERATREVEALLGAWRRGDAEALAALLAEGLEEYPLLYRPLTIERNRRWLSQIEPLLEKREDYLIVVGTLHLVGEQSLIDLLERKGHAVRQH